MLRESVSSYGESRLCSDPWLHYWPRSVPMSHGGHAEMGMLSLCADTPALQAMHLTSCSVDLQDLAGWPQLKALPQRLLLLD